MTRSILILALAASIAGAVPAVAQAADKPVWPNTPLARTEAFALLQTLEVNLLRRDSATLVLDDWCALHRLAAPGTKIVAERVRGRDKAITAEQRVLLRVDAGEPVRYRRVRLRCGARILSEADNWYVPARLTPEMNAALDSTDIAFGRAVQPLHFHRQTLSAQMLWSPLPDDWDGSAKPVPRGIGKTLAIPDKLIEHRGVLSLPDGTPFSEVVETYTGEVLAFTPPTFAR